MLELARDLDTPERRAALMELLAGVEEARALQADPELAWRAYACGLLADALSED